jgi:dTDP-4-amino-4,6-dideoxygalactose transaminase
MTSTARTLALLGGDAAFAEKQHVGKPNVGDRASFLRRVEDMLDRRWFTNDGPFVQEFERRVAGLCQVRHCIAMCNATVALEIATRAMNLSGEVIVPSYTFVATAHALQWQQITPVFADIDDRTHCLDATAVERMITPRTTGIMGVHLWGQPCDTAALEAVAAQHKLKILYDAAHAFTGRHDGKMIGGFGACEVFSFHATKFFNTLEGGAVVTNDDDLARTMRLMRNFGFAGFDNVQHVGTNGKMNEVSAAMGLTNLDAIDTVIAVNRHNWRQYHARIQQLQGLKLFMPTEPDHWNHQYVVVEVDTASPLERDDYVAVLQAENVVARKYFWPGAHRMEPYRSLQPHAGLLLPATVRVANRVFLLPTGTGMSEDAVARVCDILEAAQYQAAAVRAIRVASRTL